MGRPNGHTAEEVIASVHKCHGLLSAVAQDLKVARQTVYRYVKQYPTIADAVQDERETWIDVAEKGLIQQVQKGNIVAIMFMLKTVGKSRGYIERQEVTGADGKELQPPVVNIYLPENGRSNKD